MRKATFLSLLTLAFFFPFGSHAELEGRAIMDESIKGMRLYKRPKIVVPAGWKENEAAGQEIGGVVLVREGKEPANSEVTIYAIAVRKETPRQKLESFINDDVENFKKNANQPTVTKLPNFKTGSGQFEAHQFSYLNEGKKFFQTVTFGEETDHFLSFALTGNSKAAHDGGLRAFSEVLSKFK